MADHGFFDPFLMSSAPFLRCHIVLTLLGLFLSDLVVAEAVDVCFDYSCTRVVPVEISPVILAPLAINFALTGSPAEERGLIGQAIGYLYRVAGHQTPIFRDRGGNFNDDRFQSGAMDCIDHSTTTNEWLMLLERHGWLRFHRVKPVISRGALLSIHWAARIAENETSEQFIVDSWFFDHGKPAVVMPIKDWFDKKKPLLP